jgi:predicted transcriptional regulator
MLATRQAQAPTFEVASIRPDTTGTTSGGSSPNGQVAFNNQTIRDLIRRAYEVPFERVEAPFARRSRSSSSSRLNGLQEIDRGSTFRSCGALRGSAIRDLDTRQLSRLCCATIVAVRWSNATASMAKHQIDRLTRREREIVNAVFALGNRASVEDIRSRLDTPPSDSSVRVMLARLEQKGVVRRQQDGLRNIYSITVSPTAAKRSAIQQFVQTFFGGSMRLMLTSLMRDGSWSEDDIDALRTEIERVRKERAKR